MRMMLLFEFSMKRRVRSTKFNEVIVNNFFKLINYLTVWIDGQWFRKNKKKEQNKNRI